MKNEIAKKYDGIYSQTGFEYGMGLPSKIIEDAMQYIHSGQALDLGAGMGRNSLYLASKGFKVTAVDLSMVGLNHLRHTLKEKGLDAEMIAGDIVKLGFDNNYDLIVSIAMLFHLSPHDAITVIQRAQKHTSIGGLHAISTFTKDSDFYKNELDRGGYYPETNELKNLYTGWEILEYEEVKVNARDKRPGKGRDSVVNTAANILARKPALLRS